MLARQYEAPWRTAYEFYASSGWIASACACLATTPSHMPAALGTMVTAVAAAAATLRFSHGLAILERRAALSGRAMARMRLKRFDRLIMETERVFIGYGFEWRPEHSQRLYELCKVDYRKFRVAPALVRLFGYELSHQPDDEIKLIDFAHITDAITSMIAPVRWLANSDFKPAWKPGMKP